MTLFSLIEVTDGLTQAEAVNYWQEEPCEQSMNGGKLTLAQLTFPVRCWGEGCACVIKVWRKCSLHQKRYTNMAFIRTNEKINDQKRLFWIEQQCQHHPGPQLETDVASVLKPRSLKQIWVNWKWWGSRSWCDSVVWHTAAAWSQMTLTKWKYDPTTCHLILLPLSSKGLCDTWYHTEDHFVKIKK